MKICSKASFVLLFLVLWVTPALAHRSPDTCTGSGLGISLYTNVQEVHIGDEIKYSAEVFNSANSGTNIICDVTNIQAFIITPDEKSHTISLIRTALSSGQVDTYSNVVSYTVRAKDMDSDALKATATDTGTVHQNDTDSQEVGGNQGVSVTVILPVPVPVPVVLPTPPPWCQS